MCSGKNVKSDNILNNHSEEIMVEYELFNEKTERFFGLFSNDKMLVKGDVISFCGESYIVANLMIPFDRKLRVAVWPSIIKIPDDLEDIRLLHWIQHNLKGLKIRLSNNLNTIEGEVINYWPGIKYLPPESLKQVIDSKINYTEYCNRRMEILSIDSSDTGIHDLFDFQIMEILSN